MTVHAHFDDRTIIPDEPLDLRPNQALIVQIELIGARRKSRRWHGWPPTRLTAARCAPIWPISTIITSTAALRRTRAVRVIVATCFAGTSFWIGQA